MAETAKSEPTWGVVGLMDEPAALVLAWVAHHLALGAAEAHVFLDRPDPKVSDSLAGLPGVFVTTCDDDYWAASSRGARPIRHTARQKYTATEVYRSRPLDWLLHCDADEFLQPTGDFIAELAATRSRVLRLRNFERVRRGVSDDIFAGGFRGMLTDSARAVEIHGRWADFLESGMAGYKDGKDIVRIGENFTMGVHFPIDAETGRRHSDPVHFIESARLLHFDGLTPLHNALKLLKRAMEPKYKEPRRFGTQRVRQFKYVRNHAAKPRQLQQMLDGVFALTDAQAKALGTAYVDTAFHPGAAVSALGLRADFTAAAFDAELRRREARLIEATGLAL